MLLTITSSSPPATDLGYLLHKHPGRSQTFDLAFGAAHVFYPEADDDRCTAALLLDVDPVGLVRKARGESGALDQYVNDRPYVASSFMSVAIAQVYRSALAGSSRERAELVDRPLALEATIAALPCRGGEALVRRLFEPLGYAVTAAHHPLDETVPEWGESRYFTVTLSGQARLRDFLTHIYVMIPVLDDDKHYWVGTDEVDKLLRHGAGWLPAHPERDLIADRYLKYQRRLTREALARLLDDEGDPDADEERHASEEEAVERRVSLRERRLDAVMEELDACGARRVLDLGCGEGRLLERLLKNRLVEAIAGMDVSVRALERARDRLHLDRLAPAVRKRLALFQGSLTYRDRRLEGYDAATLVEVVEHLDPPRLVAFERVLFEIARPRHVILTTPNREYNSTFVSLPAGRFRHRDHRFEWTRAELEAWARGVADRFGYAVRFRPIGPEDPGLGAPSQMAIFHLP